jgi:hypothetical protein
MNRGRPIREVLNCTVALAAPRERIPLGRGDELVLSPALAAARTLFLLSGSRALGDIAYYTKGAVRFTDDGESIPGSSYGARIFAAGDDGVSAFERTARLIESRPNTKRASIPIFWPDDVARSADTNDLPCAFGLHFAVRGPALVSTVTMRANDALKILPYNLFEFTFLAECMAARLGVSLRAHVHGSVSMHLRHVGIARARLLRAAPPAAATAPIPAFGEALRRAVSAAERAIRAQGRGAGADRILALIPPALAAGPWRDLLLAASLASAAVDGRARPAAARAAKAVAAEADAFPLTRAECARLLG